MDHSTHNKIVSFIWSIADDCLRDVFVRGKYRDVILPMFVLRRLDVLLEPTKQAVLEEVRFQREDAGFTDLEPQGLQDASNYVFYNTSKFTLKSLLGNPSQLEANLKTYLDGFSDNVKEIIEKFELRTQIRKMAAKDILHDVIEKFISSEINLSPESVKGTDGRTLPALTNLGMGYVFEELIRKFNEENNEEAGEHFTPREVIQLMTHILFEPVKDKLPPVLTVYDPACGSGGMLTESQNFILNPQGAIRANAEVYLYGKEVNDETYAICKSDMMIKGNDPEGIRCGSTLETDEFSAMKFDFILSNPPYGKSWKSDQKHIVDGKEVIDPRFKVSLKNFDGELTEESATPRSSDGQLLFLMEMVNKIKKTSDNPLGTRIASVHNGSALFTGDAGGGESNIRRYIIENDLLDTIIQLPTNLFYNTGITTYIWVLSNSKPANRKGKVQLIDASEMFKKLRKNLGQKNCELTSEHIKQITDMYLNMPNEGVSKVFDNKDFGYYKVTVERPLRLKSQFTPERVASLRFMPAVSDMASWVYEEYGDDVYKDLKEHKKEIEDYIEREEISITPKNKKLLLDAKAWKTQLEIMQSAEKLMAKVGKNEFVNFNDFSDTVSLELKQLKIKLSASHLKQILNTMSERDETAEPVIKRIHKLSGSKLETLLEKLKTTEDRLADYGYLKTSKAGEYIEYESDSELRDTENVPLSEDIYDYFQREVHPHVSDAWLKISATKIGYEISFNKYFYKHKPLRSIEEVTADILALEQETDGLLKKLITLTSTNNVEDVA